MAVRRRLTRVGKKKQPTYRIVAADRRSPRDGRFIEIIGTYNPRAEPSAIKVDNTAALKWLKNGAQPSERVKKLLELSGAWAAHTTGADAPEMFEVPEPTADDLIAATRATYDGTLVLGEDMMTFAIGDTVQPGTAGN